ncbi:DUF3008 family protein [Streptomyces chisholmiae]
MNRAEQGAAGAALAAKRDRAPPGALVLVCHRSMPHVSGPVAAR